MAILSVDRAIHDKFKFFNIGKYWNKFLSCEWMSWQYQIIINQWTQSKNIKEYIGIEFSSSSSFKVGSSLLCSFTFEVKDLVRIRLC